MAQQKLITLLKQAQHRFQLRLYIFFCLSILLLSLVLFADLAFSAGALALIVSGVILSLVPRQTYHLPAQDYMQKITERQQQQKLREQMLPQLLESFHDPLMILSQNGQVKYANQKLIRLFQLAKTGVHISKVVRSSKFVDAVEEALDLHVKRQVTYSERVPFERHFLINIEWIGHPELGPEDAALLIHFRDLSEAERLNQMRTDFIANASHELRTPLTSILGFVETLQGPAKDDPKAQAQFLDVMSKQAGRMMHLIDDLLSLSRIEMKEHQSPQELVNVERIINQVIDSLAVMIKDQEMTVKVLNSEKSISVMGDQEELSHVFQNLIENAIKYGKKQGQIDIEIKTDTANGSQAEQVVIAVKDNGIGIAAEHLPRLTERFYRVDVARSKEKGGTGLGLAIAKHILNHHRGELTIQSEVGVGSVFTVTLPLKD